MTLFEGALRNHIFIDMAAEPYYSSDQVYVSHPVKFATVTFQLIDTYFLTGIADLIRVQKGYKPMEPVDGYPVKECDEEGWYDWYVSLNDFVETKVDSCIEFIVCNSESPDNEQLYRIDLTPAEQKAMYDRLNDQCIAIYGQTCEELLAESRKELYEEEHDGDLYTKSVPA